MIEDKVAFIKSLYTPRTKDCSKEISRDGVKDFYEEIRELLFFEAYHTEFDEKRVAFLLASSEERFKHFANVCNCQKPLTYDELLSALPNLKKLFVSDIEAIYDGDPAARSHLEIVLSYPGFIAISAHRLAHLLLKGGYPFIARVISEYAHSRTGIDIHPGAEIASGFFIDHGTGIVIGETTKIGEHVKLYQGVTLGALSLKDGRKLEGQKRHPTIEDNVTIYAGATILGGTTIIGHDSIIGSNAYITSSVPPFSLVRVNPFDLKIDKR